MTSNPRPRPDDSLLRQIESAAVDMAREAGALLSGYFGEQVDLEYKDKEETNPVTRADKESQAMLTEAIGKEFPDHGVLGEEDEEEEGESPTAPDFVWVLDPLDGTKNFMFGLPFYACSIGILYQGAPVAGAIYLPWPGEVGGVIQHARVGGGAYADDTPIAVFEAEESKGNRIMAVPSFFGAALRFRKEARNKVGDVRVSGSLAYEMAMTASGVLQYMITLSPMIWDVAAGVLITQEAGGLVMSGLPSRRMGLVPDLRWEPWDAFIPWRPGETTMGDLRRWSAPLTLGSPSVVRYVTGNLSTHWRPGRQVQRAVRKVLRAGRRKKAK